MSVKGSGGPAKTAEEFPRPAAWEIPSDRLLHLKFTRFFLTPVSTRLPIEIVY
jgi:hypothetical protein